jgi:hypothetical protein
MGGGSAAVKPIKIQVTGQSPLSASDICAQFLDTARWSEFTGYGLLPGIRSAQFETRTPNLVGSRIRVCNTDSSTHLEEIIQWDEDTGFSLRFQDFQPPLSHLASCFVESWSLRSDGDGTHITRSMELVPRNWLGSILLRPIAKMMQKAFEKQKET